MLFSEGDNFVQQVLEHGGFQPTYAELEFPPGASNRKRDTFLKCDN